jgi:UDP-N-acetylmuramoyl-tripeptide--D-alanyl-D-alanine ligase
MTHSIEQLYSLFQEYPKICTDTRKIEKDSLFFSLSGPSFNGNTFAAQAIEQGCKYAIVDDASFVQDERFILVDNTLLALQNLARHHRRQLNVRVIGITGSNGKTTTKELVRNVLAKKFKTQATLGNLNNHIGVPLTLLKLDASIEMAIIEMGASKQGDIKELVEIAEPDFGLITNIGLAHLEGMGGPEGVVKTKTELYDYLRNQNGLVFINTHHAVFEEKSIGMRQFRFGANASDDVIGAFEGSHPFVSFRWKLKDAVEDRPLIETQLMGRYNYENILAAVAIGVYFDVNVQEINDAVSSYSPDNNRSQLIDTGKNTLIMDAYNANPTSLEAALLNFAAMEKENKVVIIGKMMELGPTSLEQHSKIGQLAVSSGFDKVFLIGDNYQLSGITGADQLFSSTEEAIDWFSQHPILGSTILIKGSRANQLEKLQPLF